MAPGAIREFQISSSAMALSAVHRSCFPSTPLESVPSESSQIEPLLVKSDDNVSLFPIRYPDLYALYKKATASFWRVEEVDLQDDIAQFSNLTEGEQHFIKMVLAFFNFSDIIVIESVVQRIFEDVQIPEARLFLSFQVAIESVHSEMYSMFIDSLVTESDEKLRLFHGLEHFPFLRKKATWARRFIGDDVDFGKRTVGFIIVEGLFFSASFAAIFYLKKRGICKGLAFANKLISADEALHTEFGATLLRHVRNKPSPAWIRDTVRAAVEVEEEFVTGSLPLKLIGMNSDLMVQYVQFVADYLLDMMGCDKFYNVSNPFDFMAMQGMLDKANFFETKAVYRLPQPTVTDRVFTMDEDF
ncbi:ribonucleoside-diphosphate reductase subunit M2 [Gonapodya prolifera JEL478]|uniref:Ribonucleoside-diphosphate reductase subunit M2 n=1 Tax=Gonapodya prolifera (strain JEL478) TaxID=1344416 RepID=A0A139ACD1_GONPJ|nr:ribonucleoside-diphosphate reductase subunit M2 [Gonapodya prolifera JEL478]|eukprot:KXS14430.1 ribonucleoside-diphosphate reductase subunit M2 [Gonapodya prolifera JEL478]